MNSTDGNITLNDEDLIDQAQELYHKEQILAAARLLRQVHDKEQLFTRFHHKLLHDAEICETAVNDLLSSPDEDWIKQGESHGRYDTTIYYKIESPGAKLTCRIETPIASSLLVPLVSVLNESSLYDTWIPSWKKPVKLGIQESNQLLNDTRGHQIIQIHTHVPWPLAPREVIMDALALDDIDEQGFIVVKMRTNLESSDDLPEGFTLPPVPSNMERIEFDGAILFRACPTDYPNYESSRKKLILGEGKHGDQQEKWRREPNNGETDGIDQEYEDDLILVQYTMYFDAHVTMVPSSVINFVTRTVIGRIWAMLLSVAEDVRSGNRLDHQEMINAKQELYSWIKERTHVMFDLLKKDQERKLSGAATASKIHKGSPNKTISNITNSSFSDNENNNETQQSGWTMEEAMKIAS